MIAALLGTGPVADAFLVAFQLVNVVRRLLSEGALNAALVPAWLRVREAEGGEVLVWPDLLFHALTALYDRDRSGEGRLVEGEFRPGGTGRASGTQHQHARSIQC